MHRPPRLASVMTPFPYSVDASSSAAEARAMMEEHAVHHLPVMEGERIVGVITSGALEDAPAGTPAGVLHTRDPYVVDITTSLEAVLRTMDEQRLGSVIVTRGGRLAGVFTWRDACRAYADHLSREFPPPGDGHEAA